MENQEIMAENTRQEYGDMMAVNKSQESRLLSVEDKWKIIFNEKTRAPIYAVTQYVDHIKMFLGDKGTKQWSRDRTIDDRSESLHPISYMLRKLKFDLKMSYKSFVEEFVTKPNCGISYLVQLLKALLNTGSRLSGSTKKSSLKEYKKTLTDEHDCLLCIIYSFRVKESLDLLLEESYGLETIAMCLISNFVKCRTSAIEILSIAFTSPNGFGRVLDCFSYLRLKIGEVVRFKFLINMLNVQSPQNVIFQVSCMKFINSFLKAAENLNARVALQHEIECAGFSVDVFDSVLERNGLEYEDLKSELNEWQESYIDVDAIMASFDRRPQRNNQENKIFKAEKRLLESRIRTLEEQLQTFKEALAAKRDASCQCDTGLIKKILKDASCQCQISSFTKWTSKKKKKAPPVPSKPAKDYFPFKSQEIVSLMEPVPQQQLNQTELLPDYDDSITVDTEESMDKVLGWLDTHCRDPNTLVPDIQSSSSQSKRLYNYTERSDLTCEHKAMLSVCKCSETSKQDCRNEILKQNVHKEDSLCNAIPYCRRKISTNDIFFKRNEVYHKTDCYHSNTVQRSGTPNVMLNSPQFRKKPLETHSQSSDSAIGGSGKERSWNERESQNRKYMDHTEAEVQIDPSDSISNCPMNEPEPDYSSVGSRVSVGYDIMDILKEFDKLDGYLVSPTDSRPKMSAFVTVTPMVNI
ncbi:hypothetical protein CHS0354_034295 [Potamilus streckersoni]|uniref:GBD/FH3 domain-containing protein n=1 Tax=Potamilus streckersoni TaxID=2493646 RepID=A0AAE0WAI9_9BIVA|nr:hypothetical protein CHS0354_034295 [Potamilus streckersoni]